MTLTIPQLYDTMYVRYNPYAEEARHADGEALQESQASQTRPPAAAPLHLPLRLHGGRLGVPPLRRLRALPEIPGPVIPARGLLPVPHITVPWCGCAINGATADTPVAEQATMFAEAEG